MIMQLIVSFEGLVLFTLLRNLLSIGGLMYSPAVNFSWWPLFRIAIYSLLSYSVIIININLVNRFRRAQKIEFDIAPRSSTTTEVPTVISISRVVPSFTSPLEKSYETLSPELENTFRPRRKIVRKNKK